MITKSNFSFSSTFIKCTLQLKMPLDIYTQSKISPELEAIIGLKEASKCEVITKVWAYVKENNLQDPENRGIVICDDKLKKVFGEPKFRAFGMFSTLQNHMY